MQLVNRANHANRANRANRAFCSILQDGIAFGNLMPLWSRDHELQGGVRQMRKWPPTAAKCCKNATNFFPDALLYKIIKLV